MSGPGLADAARARGAVLGEIDGRPLALRFGDPEAEYRALRGGAAAVDLAFLERLAVTGADREPFLQGMLSNDVCGLAPGSGRPALLLTDQGKVVADVAVLARPDALLLDGIARGIEQAADALARYVVADDVELAAAGDAAHAVGIAGPGAAAVLGRLGLDAPPAAPWGHADARLGGVAVHVVRLAVPDGFAVHAPAAAAAAVWSAAVDAGAVPAGLEAWDVLRIERGVPWYGRDVGLDTIALEAPYDAAISFAKGCYLGQEVMERVTARGHVNRKLTGLVVAGDAPPAAGARLLAGDKDVGWITSAAWSWALGAVAALGYVRREHLAAGTALAVRDEAGTRPATVRGLPLAA